MRCLEFVQSMEGTGVTPDGRITRLMAVKTTVESSKGCSCGETHRKMVFQLKRKVEKLEEVVADKDALIASLRAKNRTITAELMEFQLQKLQQALSEKDSALALMELKLNQNSSTDLSSERKELLSHVETLRAERNKLAVQFKSKIEARFAVMRQDSDEVLSAVAREYGSCNRDQLCDELRSLDLNIMNLKSYIDQLLALALENNPSLLEGMPRIQQNSGLKMELFSLASPTELLEELRDRGENCRSLHHYASQLMQKLTEQAPHLLDSTLLPNWEELCKCEHMQGCGQWRCEPVVANGRDGSPAT